LISPFSKKGKKRDFGDVAYEKINPLFTGVSKVGCVPTFSIGEIFAQLGEKIALNLSCFNIVV
jgi:hypothetical protein